MKQPRTTRRLATQVIRRPWKKRVTDDLDGGFGMQMFGHLARKQTRLTAAALCGTTVVIGGDCWSIPTDSAGRKIDVEPRYPALPMF